MASTTDRKGQILNWDDLFAANADRAAAAPVDAVDRDLSAMGFDPAGVQERVAAIEVALARPTLTGTEAQHEPPRTETASASMPDEPALRGGPLAWASSAGLFAGWNFGSAVAGAMVVLIAGVIGLVAMHGIVGSPGPTLAALDKQTGVLMAQHNYQDAERLFRLALSLEEEESGPAHPRVAARLNDLAHVLRTTNRLDEAEPLMLRALEIDRQHFATNPTAVARDLNNLAQLLEATYRHEAAEEPYRFALTIFEQHSGPDHPDVATVLSNLANVLQATDRADEAEALVMRALEIGEINFGPDHETVARNRANLRLLREASTSCTHKIQSEGVESVVIRSEEIARQGVPARPGQHLQLAKWHVKSKSAKCAI
jgi:tetratricopeptide (TPR) repeat protein